MGRWIKGNGGYIYTEQKFVLPKEIETLNCIIKDISYLKPTKQELTAMYVCSKIIHEQTPMEEVLLMYDMIKGEINEQDED